MQPASWKTAFFVSVSWLKVNRGDLGSVCVEQNGYAREGLLVDHLARGLEIQVEKNAESEQERTVCPKLEMQI